MRILASVPVRRNFRWKADPVQGPNPVKSGHRVEREKL